MDSCFNNYWNFTFPHSVFFFYQYKNLFNKNLKILGPLTPLGGLFIIIGWFLLIIEFLSPYLN